MPERLVERNSEIRRLRAEGKGYNKIAELLEMRPGHVYEVLNRERTREQKRAAKEAAERRNGGGSQ